jgi:hypothetical protein
MDYLTFYNKFKTKLKKINISYIRDNCTDIYYFFKEQNDFTYCIEYIQSHINNIKNSVEIEYKVDTDTMDDLIATKQYIELKKFYLDEINKLTSVLNNNDNIYVDNNMTEDDKILTNKLKEIKYSFEEFNSNCENYYIIE